MSCWQQATIHAPVHSLLFTIWIDFPTILLPYSSHTKSTKSGPPSSSFLDKIQIFNVVCGQVYFEVGIELLLLSFMVVLSDAWELGEKLTSYMVVFEVNEVKHGYFKLLIRT